MRRKSTLEEFKSDYKESPIHPRNSSAKKGMNVDSKVDLSSEALNSIFASAAFTEFFDKSTKLLEKALPNSDNDFMEQPSKPVPKNQK